MRSASQVIVIPLSLPFAEVMMTKSLRRERGFALFELVLAIAMASLIGVWAASSWIRQVDDVAAQATGVWLLTVKKAMDQMLSRQSDWITGIRPSMPGAGDYADLWQPRVAELINAGHLPKGFALKPPLPYQIAINVFAPVGDCAQIGCRVDALIHARPLQADHAGAVDTNRLGQILTALAGVGASVHPLRPERIKGAIVDMANPPHSGMTPLPAGSIVALSFYDSAQFAQFVRRDDKRDTALAGKLNVKSVISSAAGLTTSAGVHAQGRVSAGEFLQLGGIASASAPCETEGLIARNTVGELMTCHAGRWQSSGSRFGGTFSLHSRLNCHFRDWDITMVNPVTGRCDCPAGFEPFPISRWKYQSEEYDEFRTFICMR